ncbi:type III-A CRISPR-associated protein Cas10/Csm1 [Methylococcus geothermalis]|uniref:type III-A CRISPR-associated protein Cas10/Csm1 n=1 Tax=Methylococcus geothermalis TaxID=2681310 RepID=UPI001E4BB084|nr:type III-A CRISPR-associated protein Cas10/Csm1 [Methylococcus geothermalis]
MTDQPRLAASSRVALAAYLHDLGKFAERARIGEAKEQFADGTVRVELEKQLHCPSFNGRHTHIHAAYTAIGFDLLEQHLPDLVGEDMAPFAPWRDRNADDSIINAAARHHRPGTYLQWIVATADRLASGFEREEFDTYNAAPDEETQKLNHYTKRQLTLLEQIRLQAHQNGEVPKFRYPLAPLSPNSLFPVRAEEHERPDNAAAQRLYAKLWEGFKTALGQIPQTHRSSLPLWLDHFDCLWQTFTHAIPAATAGQVKPEVSLYDHSRTTAALAVALWRYHSDCAHDLGAVHDSFRALWDRQREGSDIAREAWKEEKFLLIQGDFFGIQDFIFATGGETQRRAAKLLRGRSFYVSLLTELAALRLLETLDLPPTSQVVNAAGKFLILAPNTPEARETVTAVQAEFDRWFLQHTHGQSGIGLAMLPARARDFQAGKRGEESPFRALTKRLFEQLEETKLRRFGLCSGTPAPPLFQGFLDAFDSNKGACAVDGRSPAKAALEGEENLFVSDLAADQIKTGHWLATQQRVLITAQTLDHHTLDLPIFGYRVNFTEGEDDTGRFGREAKTGNLRRCWDFSLPASFDAPLWNGYARRYINAYVPRFHAVNEWEAERYRGMENPATFDPHPDEIKTLNHLARDDRQVDPNGHWYGQEALMTLKGDVDDLGLIFQKGLERPSFAKMAALSRQMNAFFAVYLPWLCAHGEEDGVKRYRNTYTVFAGGDDFFLIGPWHSTLRLAQRMKKDFARYVADNPEIHFSAGLSMTKPGLPIRQLAALAEEGLEAAKSYPPSRPPDTSPTKNAVSCFGQAVSWSDFDAILAQETVLERLAGEFGLSTGYLYGLLHLTDMAAQVSQRPENALWHAYFAYRTRRMLESRVKGGEDREATERKRRTLQSELALEIANKGIAQFGAAYKIALFTYLYQQRD